ncbi:hypothetical protein KR093_008434, partial [Drosophila rubida]
TLVLITCFVALHVVYAYPAEQISTQSQRLSAGSETDIELPLDAAVLRNLYRYERTLKRLRRAVEELEYEDAAADDMELAEINVFRPLFRYRAEIARQVKNPKQQQQFG